MGLAAAGRDPLSVRRGGHSVLDSLRGEAATLQGAGDDERTILALRACGASRVLASPAANLVAEAAARARERRLVRPPGQPHGVRDLRAARRRALGGRSGAMRAAGRLARAPAEPRRRLRLRRARRSRSDVDDTARGAAGAGRRRARAERRVRARAVAFLRARPEPRRRLPAAARRRIQRPVDRLGGPGPDRRGPRRRRRHPRAAAARRSATCESLLAPDGSVRYSRTSAQTPVWVTAPGARSPLAGQDRSRRALVAPRSRAHAVREASVTALRLRARARGRPWAGSSRFSRALALVLPLRAMSGHAYTRARPARAACTAAPSGRAWRRPLRIAALCLRGARAHVGRRRARAGRAAAGRGRAARLHAARTARSWNRLANALLAPARPAARSRSGASRSCSSRSPAASAGGARRRARAGARAAQRRAAQAAARPPARQRRAHVTSARPRGRAATRPPRWRSRCARCSSRPRARARSSRRSARAFALAVGARAADPRLAHAERRARRLSAGARCGWRWRSPRCASPSGAGRRAARAA